ncbi:MAG: hypothetical protein AAB223_05385 [Pseudomonadota bacterium]
MNKSYRFELLFKHSNETALNMRRTLKREMMEARKVFSFLDYHFQTLEKKPKSHLRNVKMALTARFINHLFAALLLIDRGLILDAFNCLRSALETTAFYWLVCRDEHAAPLYDAEKSLAPVEVRKRLEALGVDVRAIRDLYQLESTIAHVGNPYDQLQIRWEQGANGKLLIGGGPNSELQKPMLEEIIRTVFRFVKFEKDYIIPDLDNPDGTFALLRGG